MLHMFKATQDIIIATKILKRNESFDLSPSSSWQSSTLCDANKLLEKGQISTFLTPYYQICHYLAESEVVSFQWSPTVFKLKFSMKCHLTSSLRKGQPVLENSKFTTTTNFIENWKITNYITFPPANSL